jgi:polyisoprenoid-binding protein YceI
LKHRRGWALAALAAIVALLGAGYGFFALQGDDAPPPPTLSPGSADAGDAGDAATGRLTVVRSAGTFAGYRVDENYLGVGVRTAVGRTPLVSGTLTLDGSRVVAASLLADLSQLRSDQDGRDRALRVKGIETDRYPRTRFELGAPFGLSRRAQRATGTLELHGRRAPLRVSVRGQRVRRGLELVGSGRVEFRRFGIEPPSVAGLVKVEEHGVLEFRLRLQDGG